MKKFAIAVHGGAGVIPKVQMTSDLKKQYEQGLLRAVQAGYEILASRGLALDAVIEAVAALEDNPLFNAGKGSTFNRNGKQEMDASVMEGSTLQAGAVCCITHVKNPVRLAAAVLRHSDHVLLCGDGAEAFARQHNIELAPEAYFFSQPRYDQWLEAQKRQHMQLDDGPSYKIGTVGAVAFDAYGNLAAATSTGGLTNKWMGRIGDSPVIGAGTYANNATCAVSCTGHGEFFLRHVVAYDVHCLIEYKGMLLKEAVAWVINKKLASSGGEGGLIAVDKLGHVEMVFNTEGMYRAKRQQGSAAVASIY